MKNNQFLFILFLISNLYFYGCNPQSNINTEIKNNIGQVNEVDKKITAQLCRSDKNITFQVCEVEKKTAQLYSQWNPNKKYREVIINKMVTKRNKDDREDAIHNDKTIPDQKKNELIKDESFQPEGIPIRKIEALASKDISLIQTNYHSFMATMHTAYARHYPMTISPDMIWLLISQGFANHINQNPEKMRNYFVDFKGKKKLGIRRDNFRKGDENNDWQGTFEEFSEQIEDNTGVELLDLVTGNFSTTGPIEKAAFQVTLMDAMKSYFDYSISTLCGIPEITLEGTIEDWELIEAKAQELAQYDLEWWIDDLMPILHEFTMAASGNPDIEFWKSIYKWTTYASGSSDITGWILKFFPYKEVRGKLKKFKKREFKDNGQKIKYNLRATTRQLTSGLSQADFLWDYNGTYFKMEFVAGFVGCQQDSVTLSLRPEISWAVIDKQMKPTAEEIENYKSGGNKEYREHIKKQ